MLKVLPWYKSAFIFSGIAFLVWYSIVLYITFLIAYLNNNHVNVYINWFGEANFEFILLPVSLIWGVYSLYYILKPGLKIHLRRG